MSRNWTPSQQDAINSRNGSIVVSAAAGSGKTAVLVERVIKRLTDSENPTSADRLLIVTFTKAAAGEMRERITAAIEALLRENPEDVNLIKQQMLLPSAKICTIDAFCASLVKENFHLLDIAPDYKNADEGQKEIIAAESINETLCRMYEKNDKSFTDLCELLFRGKDDSYLAATVQRLYEASRSFPFPDNWLDSLCESFRVTEISKSVYGKIIIDYVSDCLRYAVGTADFLLSECSDEDIASIFLKAESEDKAQYEYILESLNKGDWDNARNGILRFKAARRGNTPKHLKEDFYIKSLVAKRDACNKKVKALSKILICTEKEFRDDMEFFLPLVDSLCRTVKLYGEIFSRNKKEKKLADFSDIAHKALSLLVSKTEDGYETTETAKRLSEQFDEILIDEYQDTNEAQDMLFTAISRNNLFRVGDVKQSIYGFRQAMPEIFIALKEKYPLYEREKDNYPAKIVLGNNFRSRKGVTDIINFIFEALMSKACGEIDYNDEERLVPSASYVDENRLGAELHFLETDELLLESSDENQARYIASLIRKMIDEGFTVKDGDGERKATYGDFAILLRSAKSRSSLYADALREAGIPAFTEPTGSFLGSSEIALAMNIFRIIDNPKQDIPLLSVMMSPIFAFTPDEIAAMRISDRKGDIYACLLSKEREGDKKAKDFCDKVRHWRKLSLCLGTAELIDEIMEDTAIPNIFDAVDPSGAKRTNLLLLKDYANTYESSGYEGLSGFIRFVDRLSENSSDLSSALSQVQSADVVRIMSIHKSKGLEFPVCILASLTGKFNKTDETENFLINLKHGIGLVRRDIDTFEQYGTLCHSAMKISMNLSSMSEELRVLYVALTRAKERLIAVCAAKNLENTLVKCADNINPRFAQISPFLVSSAANAGQWLITALLRHPDAEVLRSIIGADENIVLACDSPLKVVVARMEEKSDISITSSSYRENLADEEFIRSVKEKTDFSYKYEALSKVLTKRAASEVDKNFVDRDYFASSMPAFLYEGGLTGAQRGIATHTFMQFADYEKARENIDKEAERLVSTGVLTESQAKGINRKAIEEFFQGDLAKRILSSSLVMREKKFTVELPVYEVYEGTENFPDEKVMIQGIADCAFVEKGELVVVDYKTDSLQNDSDFIEKYKSQVVLYKKALNLCTGYKVKETLLYSFRLGRAIKVEG